MIEEKLHHMGIKLPTPPEPAGSYVPVVFTGNLAFVSGQIPVVDGSVAYVGSVHDGNIEDAKKSARLCVINVLAQLKRELGSLDRVSRIVRLSGFVSSAPGFAKHPAVLDAASDLVFEIFGDSGRHTRIAVGVAGLPLGSMTELDAVVEFS